MTDDAPATDARDPADVVVAMVEHVLDLAATAGAHMGSADQFGQSR